MDPAAYSLPSALVPAGRDVRAARVTGVGDVSGVGDGGEDGPTESSGSFSSGVVLRSLGFPLVERLDVGLHNVSCVSVVRERW